jgi:peptidoglycan/LPS O-acetylase OafA/YrhL
MRYVLLDLVRVVAITFLMTAHSAQSFGCWIGNAFGIQGFYYVTIGGVAVTIFLVLSGLLLGLLYQDRQIGYFSFMKKRIVRLYPVYYLSVLFVGIPMYFFMAYYTGTLPRAVQALGFPDLILSVTGLSSLAGRYGGPFVPTSWFIGVIMSMYLMFPPILYCMRKKPHLSMFILLALSVIFRLLLGGYQEHPSRPLDCFPLCRVGEFSLGVYLACVIRRDFWLILNKDNNRITRFITFISELSFPLFLIHSPLRPGIMFLTNHGMSRPAALTVFLAVSLMISWIVLLIDQRIHRQGMRTG